MDLLQTHFKDGRHVSLSENEKQYRQTFKKGDAFWLRTDSDGLKIGVVERQIKDNLIIRVHRAFLLSIHVNSRVYVKHLSVNMRFIKAHLELLRELDYRRRLTEQDNTLENKEPHSCHIAPKAMIQKTYAINFLGAAKQMGIINPATFQELNGWAYSFE